LLKDRRQQVHQRIAQALIERFPEIVEVEPALVAHHYTRAELINQAITFWHRAGQRAIQRSAHLEAISYLNRGLKIVSTQLESPARDEAELMLQTTIGVPLIAAKGMAAPEVERTYARARDLCVRVGDTPQLFSVLFGLWWFYELRADMRPAQKTAEQLLEIAHGLKDSGLLLQAHRAMGQTLFWLGEFASAQTQFEQANALYNPQQHRSLSHTYGQEPGVLSRGFASHALWYLGYPDRALRTMHEALDLARDVDHPLSLAFALQHAAWLHQYRGE
jgi:predicted ATPase